MNALEVKLFKMVAAGFMIVSMCGFCSCYIDGMHRKQIKNLQDHVAEIENEMNQMAQAIEKYMNEEDAE